MVCVEDVLIFSPEFEKHLQYFVTYFQSCVSPTLHYILSNVNLLSIKLRTAFVSIRKRLMPLGHSKESARGQNMFSLGLANYYSKIVKIFSGIEVHLQICCKNIQCFNGLILDQGKVRLGLSHILCYSMLRTNQTSWWQLWWHQPPIAQRKQFADNCICKYIQKRIANIVTRCVCNHFIYIVSLTRTSLYEIDQS
jgi:hypothetical protein